jgi:hypothetical protein
VNPVRLKHSIKEDTTTKLIGKYEKTIVDNNNCTHNTKSLKGKITSFA